MPQEEPGGILKGWLLRQGSLYRNQREPSPAEPEASPDVQPWVPTRSVGTRVFDTADALHFPDNLPDDSAGRYGLTRSVAGSFHTFSV
jgi:hypothetical protein